MSFKRIPSINENPYQIGNLSKTVVNVCFPPAPLVGAVGDGVADDTQALKNIFASGYTRFDMGQGKTYKILLTEGDHLASFNNLSHVYIKGNNVTIRDTTTYSNQGAFTPMFLFTGCFDIEVDGVNYVGQPIPTPTTYLGYLGAIFVQCLSGCEKIKVNARLENLRYGIQSGDYNDNTKGNCKNFEVDLVTHFCGYPIAAYLAEDIKANITAYDFHRAVYLAGVNGANIRTRFQNQYIATVAVLMTDAISGTGNTQSVYNSYSRGCKNIQINGEDMGSTVFQSSSMVAGISLSRVDPGLTYEDIDVHVNVVSSDTIASTIGAFIINSNAKNYEPNYPYNWEQTIYIRNVKVSGIIDRSNQTVAGNTTGDLYIYPLDTGTHYGTVSNIDVSGLTILGSSGNTRGCYFTVPGLADVAKFTNCIIKNAQLIITTNNTSDTKLDHCILDSLDGSSTSQITIHDSVINVITDGAMAATRTHNTTFSGGGAFYKVKQITLNLSGASNTWAGAIPVGAYVLGVTGVLTQAITGATGYEVGITSDVARFVNTNNTAAGTNFKPANQGQTITSPQLYFATTDIIVTAKTSNFTGGQLKLRLYYLDFVAPTS